MKFQRRSVFFWLNCLIWKLIPRNIFMLICGTVHSIGWHKPMKFDRGWTPPTSLSGVKNTHLWVGFKTLFRLLNMTKSNDPIRDIKSVLLNLQEHLMYMGHMMFPMNMYNEICTKNHLFNTIFHYLLQLKNRVLIENKKVTPIFQLWTQCRRFMWMGVVTHTHTRTYNKHTQTTHTKTTHT